MKSLYHRFRKARRSAVALIFALTLVPLVLLVGLTVDYAFYVQARAQTALAADAAVTHAVRAADETYTYEEQINGTSQAAQAAAVAEAKAAGSALGEDWFQATLGRLPKASITGTPVVDVEQSANGAAGFTATVNFAGTYPPFFAHLFNGKVWNVNGSAQATSAYNYVEILMLLDNSPSMLIGADIPNIQKMEAITACPPTTIDAPDVDNTWNGGYYQHVADPNYGNDGNPWTYTDVEMGSIAHVQTPGTEGIWGNSTDGHGYSPPTCQTGWQGGSLTKAPYNEPGSPSAPCAFACHTTTATLNEYNGSTYAAVPGYTNDYYGLAEQNGVTLRLNVLQDAAGQVITAMETNQAASGQFSVGVYQFNDDVVPIYPAPTGGKQPEAGTDLPTAANDITNAALPLESNAGVGYTDFPQSVNDLVSGKYANGTAFGYAGSTTGLTQSGNGATSTTPEKDIFIVTDGMQDTSDPGSREEGEMTGYYAETTSSTQTDTPAICQQLKAKNFTVYVLYIDYEPLSNTFYQTSNTNSDAYLDQDYPGLAGGTSKQFAESTAESQAAPPAGNAALTKLTPDETALYACASSPSDFFEATNSSEIGTALNAMLQSALTSSIQLTK